MYLTCGEPDTWRRGASTLQSGPRRWTGSRRGGTRTRPRSYPRGMTAGTPPDQFPWTDEDLPDLTRKILAAERSCIVLDDSGGAPDPSLDVGRKLWSATLFDHATAFACLHTHNLYEPNTLARTGRKTWHFTELWSGNGPYEKWPVEDRLAPIENLGTVLMMSEAPVVVVQMTPAMIDIMGQRITLPTGPWFDLTDPDGAALRLALEAMKKVVNDKHLTTEVTAVCDRWKDERTKFAVIMTGEGEPLFDWLTPPGVGYTAMDDFPLLQYADLVVWGYSRLELFEARGVRNQYEQQLFDLLVRISRGWMTYAVDANGNESVKKLGDLESHPMPGRVKIL